MQFSPAAFNAHWARNGQDVMWRSAAACPCFNPGSGAAKATCPLCRGKGWMWGAEQGPYRIGVMNQDAKKAMAQFGVWEAGQVLLSIGSDSPLYAMGRNDRVRTLNSTNPFSELLTRGENDKLNGTIQSITRVFWLNPAGDTIVEGGIPTVAADGVMTWSSGEPPAGQQYCINGVRFDEYYAFLELPVDRNHQGGAALPRKLPAKKFDLFGR